MNWKLYFIAPTTRLQIKLQLTKYMMKTYGDICYEVKEYFV